MDPGSGSPRHPALRVLSDRDVRRFIAARFFAGVARTLLRAALFWQVWDLTGSKAMLGAIGLVQFLPALPATLYAGALADSMDRRRVMMAALAGSVALALGLWWASRGGDAPVSVVFALIFCVALANAFESPSGVALLPTLVAPELFPAATTALSTFRNLAWALGPVVAGFVIEERGVAAAYALAAALLGLSIVCVLFVRSRFDYSERREASLDSIREGIAFVRRERPILASMTLDMFAVIFASVTALLPVFADEILEVGPRGYGLLSSAVEVGTLLMAAVLMVRPPIHRPGRALLASVACFGAATVVFGLSRSFPLSLAALVVTGMADQVSMVTRSVIVQLSTPNALRGRVSAVNMVFISASNQIGAVESGFLAAVTSATFSVVFGGVACLGVLALLAARVPELRHYRPPPLER